MTFLRRLLRRAEPGEEPERTPYPALPSEPPAPEPVEALPPEPRSTEGMPTCPYCAFVLDPPPARNRLCPSCRQRIILRRVEGRLVLLPDAALPVFERERLRTADEQRWTTEKEGWLKLAEAVHAPAKARSRLASAEPSAANVDASRELYLAAADKLIRSARRKKRWSEVAMIQRTAAASLYHEAGAVVPPPEAVVTRHREGMLAELHAMTDVTQHAELVGASCCPACRAFDGRVFRIADELRAPRLPHDGCPKGICACDWWLAMTDPKAARAKRRRKTPAPAVAASVNVVEETPDDPSLEDPTPADPMPVDPVPVEVGAEAEDRAS